MDASPRTTSSLMDLLKDTFGSCYVCDCDNVPLIDMSREHQEPGNNAQLAAVVLPKAALESKPLPTLLKKQEPYWFPDSRKILEQAAGQQGEKHVHFREQDSLKDDFTPYALKYGIAPAEFDFGADGDMVPTPNTKVLDRVSHALGLGFGFSLPPSLVPRTLVQQTYQSLNQLGSQASSSQKSQSLRQQSSQVAVLTLAPQAAQSLMRKSQSLPTLQSLAAGPWGSHAVAACMQMPRDTSMVHKSSTIESTGSTGSLQSQSCRTAQLHQPAPIQAAYLLRPFAAGFSPQDAGYQTPRFFMS
eukprot:TRINITY_DN57724_c0_g1_i1.p1 TRINITY_DN57724_c0_g1~~TRINITY_DN57724_c0_g1_i1.p1  ORF type:complete len:301 (-),score=49.92 TRINITY_DN57724_c0_g1_i1:44-946(-)